MSTVSSLSVWNPPPNVTGPGVQQHFHMAQLHAIEHVYILIHLS